MQQGANPLDAPIYQYRTKPLQHQLEVFEATRDRKTFSYFWEMGTGKTKAAVDLAAYLYELGRIEAVLVVAPTGIHENWDIPDEGIRKHLPEDLLKGSYRMIWHSNKAGLVASKKQFTRLMEHKGGMRWLFMGYDTLITKNGFAAALQFVENYRCLGVLDEAARIKNPQAHRTKALMKLRPLIPYRRPMTGTPMAQRPFDVYAIVRWMDPTYWVENGFGSFLAFKHHFGVWRKMKVNAGREVEVQATDKEGRPVYKNLDELARLLKPISSRVLKHDVLDLPTKVYTHAYYELTPRQRQFYDKMEEEFLVWYEQNTEIDEDGNKGLFSSTAELAIVRQMRLHQIAMGYIVSDDGVFSMIDEKNPALDLLEALTEDLTTPAIVWARFRKDVDLIMERLAGRAMRFDGTTAAPDRVKAVAALQGGHTQFIVATQATMGEGVTLTAAKSAFYYSNSRKLVDRLQSEDRCHRIGQVDSVQYVDILGRNTIAEDILAALRHGENVAAMAIGDKIRQRRYG